MKGKGLYFQKLKLTTGMPPSAILSRPGVPAAVRQSRNTSSLGTGMSFHWTRLTCNYPLLHMHVI
jgi:hypothetical protein